MSAPPVVAAAPNWAEITTEPQCPLCEYMLRGLNVARCPECGFKFEWSEVLEASRRDHPYLFEHFPDRNLWSYFKTVRGAMRPRRFWSLLHPSQRGSIRRLVIYGLWGFMISAAVVLMMPGTFVFARVLLDRQFGHYAQNPRLAHLQQPFWDEIGERLNWAYTGRATPEMLCVALLVIGLWPWILHITLQLFSESMRKARIRPMHVLRCVIYSVDLTLVALLLLIGSIIGIGAMASEAAKVANIKSSKLVEEMILWVILLTLLFHTYRLGVAYRRYLRFDHSMAVAISAQLITGLSILSAMILIRD